MRLITRRLMTRGATVTGTLAVAGSWRKPAAAAEHDLGSLVRRDPPAPPPPISFTAADGSPHGLAEFAGKGVVLNCWATWCVPCVEEMPALATLAGRLKEAGVVVLALSSDRAGAPAVQKFYKDHAIEGLGIWLDPRGDAMRTLQMRGIPTTLLLDRQGREQGRIEGAVDWAAADTVARVKTLTGA